MFPYEECQSLAFVSIQLTQIVFFFKGGSHAIFGLNKSTAFYSKCYEWDKDVVKKILAFVQTEQEANVARHGVETTALLVLQWLPATPSNFFKLHSCVGWPQPPAQFPLSHHHFLVSLRSRSKQVSTCRRQMPIIKYTWDLAILYSVKTERVSGIRSHRVSEACSMNRTETTGQLFTKLHLIKRDSFLIRH